MAFYTIRDHYMKTICAERHDASLCLRDAPDRDILDVFEYFYKEYDVFVERFARVRDLQKPLSADERRGLEIILHSILEKRALLDSYREKMAKDKK